MHITHPILTLIIILVSITGSILLLSARFKSVRAAITTVPNASAPAPPQGAPARRASPPPAAPQSRPVPGWKIVEYLIIAAILVEAGVLLVLLLPRIPDFWAMIMGSRPNATSVVHRPSRLALFGSVTEESVTPETEVKVDVLAPPNGSYDPMDDAKTMAGHFGTIY
jgi:hypothetical protein